MKHSVLDALFKKLLQYNDIKAISLSTEDGFTIHSVLAGSFVIEEDKLSAVVSSLASLSDAAAQQVIQAALLHTVIETEQGDVLILKTYYRRQAVVLCLITTAKQSLGKARYYAVKLAQAIKKIPA